MGWNRQQQIALAVIPKISSVLSLFGSAWIIIEVLTDSDVNKPKMRLSYHRLLFAMSFYDVLETSWNFFSTWPIPAETEDVIWASGTTATCSAQGFFLTLGVAVPIYNAMLSLYYVLVIKYHFTERTLRQWVEPTMHCIAFVWAFGTALYSASTGLVNNANLWCWIAPLPADCLDSWRYGDEGNCVRGDNAWFYRVLFYFAPLWFCVFIATACTIMVYQYVRKLDTETLRYRHPERFSHLSDVVLDDAVQERREATKRRPTVSCANTPGGDKESRSSDDGSNDEERNYPQTPETRADKASDSESSSKDANEADKSESSEGQSSRPNIKNGEDNDGIGANLRGVLTRWHSSRLQYREEHKRTVEVHHQALFYLGTLYLTHFWSTSNRIVQFINNGTTFYPLIAIHAFFDPLQGFLNYFVYQRPRYLVIRKRYPEIGRTGALYRMLRFSCLPEPRVWIEKSRAFEARNSLVGEC